MLFFSMILHAAELDELCFDSGPCYQIERADTPELQMRGLMHRRYLPANSGMLFVFDVPDTHGFWMKNTYISLDIVWMDADKNVVALRENMPLCIFNTGCPIYKPDHAALYALEIRAGEIAANGIFVGQEARFR